MPNRLGGLEVDYKLERGGLLDRQIGRFRAAEYLGDHSGALTKNVHEARTIAEQASLFGHFGPLIDRRQAQFRGTLDNDAAVEEQHRRRQHVERTCTARARIVHRRHQFFCFCSTNDQQLLSVRPRSFLQSLEVPQCRNIGVREGCDAGRAGHRLDQDVLPFAVKIGRHQADSGDIAARAGKRGRKPSRDHVLGDDHDRNCPVAFWRARGMTSPPAMIASGAALISAGTRSSIWLLPAWKPPGIIARFWPSTKPWTRNSSKKAMIAGASLATGRKKPRR